MSRSPKYADSRREAREDSAAFLARWRAQGGYEGACRRAGQQPVTDRWYPEVRHFAHARGHMPFPNHRHMGEVG